MGGDEQSPSDEIPTRRVAPDELDTTRALAPGRTVFGRYVLGRVAGRGGMGVVWRAQDTILGETVALKFLPEVVARDAVAIDDLKEETRRARRLTHPHIVRIHDFVCDEHQAAVSMEFVAGQTLGHLRLAQPGKVFSADALAPVVGQLCAALDYAHRQAKVVHRDLKPANLLVADDGQLKVTDFGIARSLSDTQTRLTGKTPGDTSGTLPYMSPQQLAGEKPTAADDIYALGATLYELLAGKPPFHRGDAFSLMKQIAERPPLSLAAQRQDLEINAAPVPAHWEAAILACLAKDPQDRPPGAADVAARLGLAGGGAVPAALPPAPTKAVTAQQPTPSPVSPNRSLAPLWIGLAALALIGAGYYFGLWRPEQARQAKLAEIEAKEAADRVRLADLARLQHQRAIAEQAGFDDARAHIATIGVDADDATLRQEDDRVDAYTRLAPGNRAKEVQELWATKRAEVAAYREKVRTPADESRRQEERAAEIRRQEAAHPWKTIEAYEKAGRPVENIPAIAQEPAVGAAREKLQALARQRAELSSRFLDRHPRMIELANAMSNAREELQRAVRAAAEKQKDDYERRSPAATPGISGNEEPAAGRSSRALTGPADSASLVPAAAAQRIYALAELDQKPVLRRRVEPVYPEVLRRAGVSGSVLVAFIVNAGGAVEQTHVLRSNRALFDQSAIDAVRQWKFTPGRKDNRPVSVKMEVPVRFVSP